MCIYIFINEIVKNRFGIWCNELQQNLTSNDAKKNRYGWFQFSTTLFFLFCPSLFSYSIANRNSDGLKDG